MPVVYRNNNNNNNNQNDNGILGIIGLGIIGLGLFVVFHTVVFIGLSIFTAVTSLTVPAIVQTFLAFSAPTTLSISDCLLLGIEGFLGGAVIGFIRKYFHIRNEFGKNLFAEFFTLQKLEKSIVSTIILDILVGFIVGWIAGVGGAHSLSQISFIDHVIDPNSIIGKLIAGGGAGGVGLGSNILLFLFIVVVYIIQGIIVGFGSGLSFGMLFGAIAGAIKGGTFESLICLFDAKGDVSKIKIFGKSALKGTVEGAIVGGIVGLIQGIITAIITLKNKNE